LVGDCLVASIHAHIAFLALAEIAERAVCGPLVGVTVTPPGSARKREYQRMSHWGADPALHLTAVFRMNIATTVVSSPDFEIVDWRAFAMLLSGLSRQLGQARQPDHTTRARA
jgi:hypothetical protein